MTLIEPSRTEPVRAAPSRIEPLRLAESGAQAALILALVVLPSRGQALDVQFTLVLAGMLAVLTLAAYALHAVTFDYFRLTGGRATGTVERRDP